MRASHLLYAAMQIGIVGGFIWWFVSDPSSPEVGIHVPAIIGGFFAVMATAIVYWANRGIRRLLGKPNPPMGEPVFERSMIDLTDFAPGRKRRTGKHRRDTKDR